MKLKTIALLLSAVFVISCTPTGVDTKPVVKAAEDDQQNEATAQCSAEDPSEPAVADGISMHTLVEKENGDTVEMMLDDNVNNFCYIYTSSGTGNVTMSCMHNAYSTDSDATKRIRQLP